MTDPIKPATDEEIARGHDDYDYHPAYEAFVERLIARIDAEKARATRLEDQLAGKTFFCAECERRATREITGHE